MGAKLTFKGGIHPNDGKALSKGKPITDYFPEGDMVYMLSQHIGAPAEPVVEVGEQVFAGQLIAKAKGFVSANIHASVSGKIKAIEARRAVTGEMADAIVIENDGKYEEISFGKKTPLDQMSRDMILEKVKSAGVVGMGGAGFPTHIKLSPAHPEEIRYVIANCAECEPYLTSDYRRMLEEPEKIISGMQVVLALFGEAKGILAVEDNKKDCIRKLEELVKNEPRISVKTLNTKYPQGAERQLIYAATGRKINSTMLPADAGCIVNNVDTLVSVHNAVMENRPVMNRIVTVTGDAIKQPGNFRVRIGTCYQELIKEAGGFREQPQKIISGGPMMGIAIFDTQIPVTKTSSAILCMKKDEVRHEVPGPCINCGKCVEVCPGRIVPSRLATLADRHEEDLFLKCDGMECCECGCCSYVCPAKRQLTQSIKSMRKMLLAKKKR